MRAGNAGQFRLGALCVDHDMAEFVRQRDEIAFRIDDALLHPGRALFQQPAQQMRLARPGIALDEQSGRQEFLKVEHGRLARLRRSHVDVDFHSAPFRERSSSLPGGEARPSGY